MKLKCARFFWILWLSLILYGADAKAEKSYFSLDGVFFKKDGPVLNLQQLHGYFSWEYPPGDFDNGTGTFLYLDIPGTAHDHTDLLAVIERGSIEITLDANVHDDGVDITLQLLDPFTSDGPATIDTERSKFDIGGNGFYSGTIHSGRVMPFEFKLSIELRSPNSARVWWTPDYPVGPVLRQSTTLAPASWVNAPSGNPLSVSTTEPRMLYRLRLP